MPTRFGSISSAWRRSWMPSVPGIIRSDSSRSNSPSRSGVQAPRRGRTARGPRTLFGERLAQGAHQLDLVVDDEQAAAAGRAWTWRDASRRESAVTPIVAGRRRSCPGGPGRVTRTVVPAPDLALDLQRALVLLDDPPADGQPQPRPLALLLGGEERLEHRGQVFGGMPTPVSATSMHHGRRRRPAVAGPDPGDQPPAVGHGVGGVGEQVQEHLPQVLPVGVDGRHVRGELRLRRGLRRLRRWWLGQLDRLGDLLADVHGGDLVAAGAAELEQVGDQPGHPLDLLLDDLQRPCGAGRPAASWPAPPRSAG